MKLVDALRQIVNNPAVSYWLKDAIESLLKRDPVDAYKDARLLHGLMENRVKELSSINEYYGLR